MKWIANRFAYFSASMGVLTRIENTALWMSILMVPKVFATALAPLWALAGIMGALLGILRRSLFAVAAGGLGAALMIRHIRAVTAPHDGFERAFGPDWEARIPQLLKDRMLEHRWPLLLPTTPGVPFTQDVVCGTTDSGDPLLCDIWTPPDGVARTGLAVIYLHGSGWHYGSKDMMTRPFFRHLAGQGHVIIDVAYSLAPRVNLHGMMRDVYRAVLWMKAHAEEYGVDPARIVLAGGSAGAHLALLAAYAPNHPEFMPPEISGDTSVRGVVSYYGPPDLFALHEWVRHMNAGPGEEVVLLAVGYMVKLAGMDSISDVEEVVLTSRMMPSLLGGEPEDVPELYQLGSAINYVGAHCPPTLLLQGGHDSTIRPWPVRMLYEKLQEAGVPAVYVEFPGVEHGFDLFVPQLNPAAQAAAYDCERFLALLA